MRKKAMAAGAAAILIALASPASAQGMGPGGGMGMGMWQALVGKLCAKDIETHCKGADQGPDQRACLEGKSKELSENCRLALEVDRAGSRPRNGTRRNSVHERDQQVLSRGRARLRPGPELPQRTRRTSWARLAPSPSITPAHVGTTKRSTCYDTEETYNRHGRNSRHTYSGQRGIRARHGARPRRQCLCP